VNTAVTASGKELALVRFYEQLKRDGIRNATELARRAGVGRAYLSRALNGRVTGKNTWKHVMPHMTEAAVFHLKQCSAWNARAEAAWLEICAWRDAARRTASHDEEEFVL
jgi:transcriptional regulator with XRE-family HTH domain